MSPVEQASSNPAAPDERGIAVIWMAVVIFLLLGIGAIAVDITHALLVSEKAQDAADAASLGGVVFLPADYPTASTTALDVAKENGFTNGVNGVVVTPTQQADTTKLKVEVKQEVPTFFARIFGFSTISVRESAVADYDQPVSMGSPANTFGNQPDCGSDPELSGCTANGGASTPQFWFNIAGPKSNKSNGDAYQANLCASDGVAVPDGCTSASGPNTDYTGDEGYSYIVRNTSAGSKLRIDVFDPGFVHVGDTCTDDGVSKLSALYAARGNDPRYATGSASQYCTGDQYFTQGDDNSLTPPQVPPWTTYRVLAPDSTPWNSADNTVISTGSCKPTDFQGYYGDLVSRWNAETAAGSPLEPLVSKYFRHWVPICTITGAEKGDYIVQVTTAKKADGSAAPQGGGHNRGSVRASLNDNLGDGGVAIFANARMSLYANANGAQTNFYLAKVVPGAGGRVLNLRFFDVGDATSAGTLTVLPPAEAKAKDSSGTLVPLTSFGQFSGTTDDCKYTPPRNGALTGLGANCSVSGVSSSAGWNGQWIDWQVPIPDGYTCDYNSPTGCWVKLSVNFGSGSVSDTTSWTARLTGNPVRLVQ